MQTKIYIIALHLALVGLATATLGLVHQNRSLRGGPSGDSGLEIGSAVVPIEMRSLDGAPRPVRWNNAGKNHLLFVFTTGCPACKEIQTGWRKLAAEAGPNTEVTGISLDSTAATRAYRDTHALPFETVVVTDRNAFVEAYEIDVVPTTLHIGGDGRVLGVWRGGLSNDQHRAVASSIRAAS